LGKLAQERVGEAVAGHADACVHGDGAVRAGDHGVEVKLCDLADGSATIFPSTG